MSKRKRRRGQGKGSNNERQLSRKLSLWWTNNERDDVFWRSAGSGNRARARGRSGKSTYGLHGDIAAVDPIGNPLTELFCIEAKKGCDNDTVTKLLDKPKRAVQQKIEEWLQKAVESQNFSGSFGWLIIHSRTRRAPIIYMPYKVYDILLDLGCFNGDLETPLLTIEANVHFIKTKKAGKKVKVVKSWHKYMRFVAMHFDTWLECVKRRDIKFMWKNWRR